MNDELIVKLWEIFFKFHSKKYASIDMKSYIMDFIKFKALFVEENKVE